MQTTRVAEVLLSSLWYDNDLSQAEAARLRQQAEQAYAAAAKSRKLAQNVTAAWQQYKQETTDVIANLSKSEQLSQLAINAAHGQQTISSTGNTKGQWVSCLCLVQSCLPAKPAYHLSHHHARVNVLIRCNTRRFQTVIRESIVLPYKHVDV